MWPSVQTKALNTEQTPIREPIAISIKPHGCSKASRTSRLGEPANQTDHDKVWGGGPSACTQLAPISLLLAAACCATAAVLRLALLCPQLLERSALLLVAPLLPALLVGTLIAAEPLRIEGLWVKRAFIKHIDEPKSLDLVKAPIGKLTNRGTHCNPA